MQDIELHIHTDSRACYQINCMESCLLLRMAVVKILALGEEHVPVLYDILRSVSNVSELTLEIEAPYPKHIPGAACGWKKNGFDLFHPLVEPGKEMVMFPNLRSIRISMCFHRNAVQDLICLLHHSPVIDSLHLIHMDQQADCEFSSPRWVPEVWHSNLLQNSEGNRKYADFANLQTGDNKSEVIKLLSGEKPSKMLRR